MKKVTIVAPMEGAIRNATANRIKFAVQSCGGQVEQSMNNTPEVGMVTVIAICDDKQSPAIIAHLGREVVKVEQHGEDVLQKTKTRARGSFEVADDEEGDDATE